MSLPPIPGWQDKASDASFSDPATCARRASKFEATIRRRNWIEYAAGVLVVFLFGSMAFGAFYKGEMLIGVSGVLTIIGTGIVMWNLSRRASNLERRSEDSCIVHLRRQYNRQYRALRDVPVWYIAPFMPGVLLFYFAVTARVADVAGWSAALSGVWPSAAVSFGIIGVVMLANWIGAKAIKRKIDEIDALA